MKMKAFSIRDAKAEIFNTPFFKTTHGEAERDFKAAVNDDKTTLHKFPEDFDLWHVGEYDTNTGTFLALETPVHCIKAVNLMTEKKV